MTSTVSPGHISKPAGLVDDRGQVRRAVRPLDGSLIFLTLLQVRAVFLGVAEATVDETHTTYAFPDEHRRRIHTNNPLELISREIRRRTRVVGAFPDGQALRAVRFANPST